MKNETKKALLIARIASLSRNEKENKGLIAKAERQLRKVDQE